MALTPDVSSGQIIQSAWGNEIRNRTVQQFSNVAQRDGWLTAAKGNLCVTTDTNTVWLHNGTGWDVFPTGASVPHARVYATAPQSVTRNAYTAVTFNAQRVNVGALHSTTTDPSRFKITTPGWYQLGASINSYTPAAQSNRKLRLRVNGTLYIAGQDETSALAPVPGHWMSSLSACWQFAGGDYAEVCIWYDDAATRDVVPDAAAANEFWISWLCP